MDPCAGLFLSRRVVYCAMLLRLNLKILKGTLRNDELPMNNDELPRLGSIIDDVAQLSAQGLDVLAMWEFAHCHILPPFNAFAGVRRRWSGCWVEGKISCKVQVGMWVKWVNAVLNYCNALCAFAILRFQTYVIRFSSTICKAISCIAEGAVVRSESMCSLCAHCVLLIVIWSSNSLSYGCYGLAGVALRVSAVRRCSSQGSKTG